MIGIGPRLNNVSGGRTQPSEKRVWVTHNHTVAHSASVTRRLREAEGSDLNISAFDSLRFV